MNDQPIIYVTQQPRPNTQGWTPNLFPATQYGALHYVFGAEDRPYCSTRKALHHAMAVLENFEEERDFILWPNSGDPAAAWAVMLALGKMGLRQIQILYWERKLENGLRSTREGFYTPIKFFL